MLLGMQSSTEKKRRRVSNAGRDHLRLGAGRGAHASWSRGQAQV